MAELRYIDDDIVHVYRFGKPHHQENLLATLFWGDNVQVVGKEGDVWKLDFAQRVWNAGTGHYEWPAIEGEISGDVRFRTDPLLKVRFVDVGQGDGAIIESPAGQLVLVDGGEEDHVRRYLSAAFAHVLRYRALACAAIVVTHGDADHFAGLTRLANATRGGTRPMITAQRVYHNGLVKGSSAGGQRNMFGTTEKVGRTTYITALEDDLRTVPDARMNRPFLAWKAALQSLGGRVSDFRIRRIQYGDDDIFDFLSSEGMQMQVLGPIVQEIEGQPVLPFLHSPGSSSLSASHTINGHSVVLMLTYGNVRFLFGADLNAESETGLLARTREDGRSLAAEVLKVPHHGSADFSPRMLEAVRPVVSVISSGDESTAQEYIHPRAGLVGALGKYSRPTVEKPLIYVTEMVAFFRKLGHIFAHPATATGHESSKVEEYMNGYVKTAFGIVHVRTDGERVLVVTHSGKAADKESYVFHVDPRGDIQFEEKASIR